MASNYTLKYGDTLGAVASQNNTTPEVLGKLNNIPDINKVQAGQTINLPGATPPAPTAPVVQPVSGEQTPAQRAAAFKDAGVPQPTTPAPSVAPVTTADLTRGSQLPDASNYTATNAGTNISNSIKEIAQKTMGSTGVAIDELKAKLQDMQATEKAATQAKVDTVAGSIDTLGKDQATAGQDALAAAREKFQVEENIKTLQTISTKIIAAQEALDNGLIYEQDRPIREQLLIGRSASLQKQGLASIGAMQATAQVIQGNIDLADSYAQTTIDAILNDNKNAMSALETLLTLHNDKLVQLTSDEKATVDSRIKALEDQDKEIKANSKDVFDLISSYPAAAVAGGVTMLDSKDTALQKMLPKMSAMELGKYNKEVNISTTTDKDGPAQDKLDMLSLKDSGMTYEEALNAFSDTLSVSWINDVYRQADPKASTPEQKLLDSYYNSFLDPVTGKPKAGVSVSVDAKGNPVVTQDTGKGFLSKLTSQLFGGN